MAASPVTYSSGLLQGVERKRIVTVIKTGDIRPLTGLRGIAASFVLFYHFTAVAATGVVFQLLFERMYMCVDLFFILSGFIIALTYHNDFLRSFSKNDYFSFIWKRIARIWPLYMFALSLKCATVLYVLYKGTPIAGTNPDTAIPSVMDVIYNILLIQDWGFAPSLNGPSWSVSTELAAYLLFPWFVIIILRGEVKTAVACSAISVLAIACISYWPSPPTLLRAGPLDISADLHPIPVIRCLAGFVIGMCVFRLGKSQLARYTRTDIFGIFVLCMMAIGIFLKLNDLFLYATLPFLILCLSQNTGLIGKIFGSKPLYFLGLISYAVYLLHAFFVYHITGTLQHIFGKFLHSELAVNLTTSITVFGIVCVTATICYYLIEKPSRVVMRRMMGQGKPRAM